MADSLWLWGNKKREKERFRETNLEKKKIGKNLQGEFSYALMVEIKTNPIIMDLVLWCYQFPQIIY